MSLENQLDTALYTQRVLPFTARKIFAAYENPALLAQWWGPNGFTNTFELFEFQPGGKWVFVMHGPEGTNYANECVFREIQPDSKIVIEHIPNPWFTLTVVLTPQGDSTHVAWEQNFESVEVANSLRSLCDTANEQNFDRLHAVLASEIA